MSERVRAVIQDMAPIRPSAVAGDSSLRMDLGYDSLSLLELVGVLEQELGLPPAADDDYELETVRDVEHVLLEKLRGTGAGRGGWQPTAR